MSSREFIGGKEIQERIECARKEQQEELEWLAIKHSMHPEPTKLYCRVCEVEYPFEEDHICPKRESEKE